MVVLGTVFFLYVKRNNMLSRALILLLQIHTKIYSLISALSVRVEGVHPKHRLMDYHRFFVDHISSADRVLDIGCGNGALAFDVAKKAKEVIAIDINEKNIQKAKSKFFRENIEYRVGDATKDLGGEVFDVVVLSNVLEHIDQRVELLQKILLIAPTVLLRVPMFDRDWLTLYKKEKGVEWRLDQTHFIEYTDEILTQELSMGGWKIQENKVCFGETWAVLKKIC